MQIHRGAQLNYQINNAVVTSGTFDGVHLGHQFLLKRLVQEAKSIGGESVILTFWPHPKLVIDPESSVQLISDLEEKLAHIEAIGIDHVWIIPFNREFSLLSSQDFIKQILVEQLHTKKLIIGYDHKFGKNREGSFEYLIANKQLFPFEIEEISRQSVEEMTFSSTLIRNYLLSGDIEKSTALLGHSYQLRGTVIKGLQNGRKMGYPTANLQLDSKHKIVPKDGSYMVEVLVKNARKFAGMLNIGLRPTHNAGRSIEVYLLDFEEDIYGEQLQINFCAKIREEKRFESLDLLKEQLKLDEYNTRLYFAKKI